MQCGDKWYLCVLQAPGWWWSGATVSVRGTELTRWTRQINYCNSPGAGLEDKQWSDLIYFYEQTELVDCANRLGAEMLGLQAELDKSACSNEVSQAAITDNQPGGSHSSHSSNTRTGSQVKQHQLQHSGEGDRVHLRQVGLDLDGQSN